MRSLPPSFVTLGLACTARRAGSTPARRSRGRAVACPIRAPADPSSGGAARCATTSQEPARCWWSRSATSAGGPAIANLLDVDELDGRVRNVVLFDSLYGAEVAQRGTLHLRPAHAVTSIVLRRSNSITSVPPRHLRQRLLGVRAAPAGSPPCSQEGTPQCRVHTPRAHRRPQ